MSRPKDLPDFEAPPIAEAVLSVQFAMPNGYQHIYAKDVWELFEAEFPNVSELGPLSPTFEVFGNRQVSFGQLSLTPLAMPPYLRYWFLNEDGTSLLQFQPDRFLQNWRNHTAPGVSYPRFENIRGQFEKNLAKLNEYFKSKGWGSIAPNQCELTYINFIPLHGDKPELCQPSFYFRKINPDFGEGSTDFALRLQKELLSPDKTPRARIYVDGTIGLDSENRRTLNLTLTMRGAPEKADIPSSLSFLEGARDVLVRSFTELTSDQAHKLWGRKQ